MKIYSIPDELPVPEPDYTAFDYAKEAAEVEDHKRKLADWLRANGSGGPNTGRIYRTPMADGYAQYMFADAGRSSYLVHLPYFDGWHDRDVEFLPKKEILSRLDRQDRADAVFGHEPVRY